MLRKNLFLYAFFSTTLLFAAGCTTCCPITKGNTENFISGVKIIRTTKTNQQPTDPSFIQLTSKSKLKTHPHKIATIQIRRYNLVGIKRQRAVIDDMLQKYTADIGGKAVIQIKETPHWVKGTIVV